MDGDTASGAGVGRSVRRKEDDRYLRGRGEFIADIRLAGMRDLAFVRGPLAHARIRAIRKPPGASVFTLADLVGVAPISANSGLPGFKPSEQTVLAGDKIRHVGEAVAVCVASSRAEAEDIAEAVELDLEELPAVVDMLAARQAGAPLVHEHWGDNVFLETVVDDDLSAIRADAAVVVQRSFRTSRQCMSPLEGRGVVAAWDRRMEQLVVHTSTQMPHIVRNGLAECLGLDQGRIRVVAPDVGGGFGYKGILLPEEVVAGWLAMHLNHPVRWIEDRREQLTGNANCREHHYDITAYADAQGRLLALDARATVDAGAYSIYPFSAGLEAAQIASILPGPYVMRGFACRTWSAATNKPPLLPYRGVARSGVCFAMDVILDAIARAVGREPHDVRLLNLVPADAMPYDNITRKHFDSGDYPECLRRAVAAIDVPAIRARQRRGEIVGVGTSMFCEQAAHGTSVYAAWGIPMVPGFEQAVARLTPDGGLELRVGIQSHGQGLETTLAQVAHEVLGIALDRVMVVHGDTALTPYSTGTWGSRCAVMAGGAVGAACRELAERIAAIGAHLLQVQADQVLVGDGKVASAAGNSVSIDEVGRTWYRRPQDLPDNVAPGGLEVTSGYKPVRDSGTFSYAAHACVVAVDTELGDARILDYVVVEDGGTLLNPMIVDGQIIGGLAQGIGTALYEEMPFDGNGQPLASTLADYLLPGATEVPAPRIGHVETPSPYSMFGQKGIGEGGAIGPPAAIANAVNDALKGFGVELTELPITPHRILTALRAARVKAASFELAHASDLAEATALLARPGARVLAGGQSLGPMLNLRLAKPDLLVRVGGIAMLSAVEETPDAVTIGACVTHAAIADGLAPDPGLRVLARVAEGIAYRAVRNRGTIGGSLCHADPAADWLTVLTALGASAITSGGRRIALPGFVTGAFRTALAPGEMLAAVRIPRLGPLARWGYVKSCRKPGEFAHAMAAVLRDGDRLRAVIGAVGGPPVLLTDAAASPDSARAALAGQLDPVAMQMQCVVLARALAEAGA